MVPKPVTLNDLERRNYRHLVLFLRSSYVKVVEDRPILSYYLRVLKYLTSLKLTIINRHF